MYLQKQKFLVSGSDDSTIKVSDLGGNIFQTLTEHKDQPVHSLVSINKNSFASASLREIRIWSVKGQINCIKTILSETVNYNIYLNRIGNDFLISRQKDEFKIWNENTHMCLKSYKEDSGIREMIQIKNNYLITSTEDYKVNLWKIN